MDLVLRKPQVWIPIAGIAIGFLYAVFVSREVPLSILEVPPQVLDQYRKLDGGESTSDRKWQTIFYSTESVMSLEGVEKRVKAKFRLENLGNGWVRRSEDWFEYQGLSAVRQERVIAYRNLFGVLGASRELAPIVHDIFGNMGWIFDRTVHVAVDAMQSYPRVKGSTGEVSRKKLTDTPADSAKLQATEYSTTTLCRVGDPVSASVVDPFLKENALRISCNSKSTGGFGDRVSEYIYVPSLDLYFKLVTEGAIDIPNLRVSSNIRDFVLVR